MSISSLRWRAPSALIAAGAAAAAVLALTVPAGAVTGTAEISPEQAGYTATGAQFQTITATVFLRDREANPFIECPGKERHLPRIGASGHCQVTHVDR